MKSSSAKKRLKSDSTLSAAQRLAQTSNRMNKDPSTEVRGSFKQIIEEASEPNQLGLDEREGQATSSFKMPSATIVNASQRKNSEWQMPPFANIQQHYVGNFDPHTGPGTYDVNPETRIGGHNLVSTNSIKYTHGVKRETSIEKTPGPCDYEHHVPKDMINNSNPKWDWKNQSERKEAVEDPEGGPGSREEHRRFDDNARVEEFGQKREIKIQQTPGPCDYEHHVPKDMINNSNPQWDWRNQTQRREPVQNPEGGPGTYEEHRRFDDNARVEEFGQHRIIKTDQTPGPCDYEHHVPKDMINNSNPKWDWRNQSERREPIQNPEGGPGTYEEHRRFNDNARVEEFGQKRDVKIQQTPGPCDYEHHVPKDMTNNSNPKWDWRNQTERREPVQNPEGGPGTYEEHRRFDDNARVEEFGQHRIIKTDQTPGPCDYEHHVPKDMINNSNPKWDWRNQTERREPVQNSHGGPGTYEEHRRFNDNARVEEFGQKREIKIDQTPGPCDYEHHVPKDMINNSDPKWDWRNQTERREPPQNPDGGPGTYEEHRRFNDNARVEEFGQKREIKIQQTPGPCDYEHHVPREMTNNSNPKWDWRNQTERREPPQNPDGGPGTYDERRRFDDNARVEEFGQKREIKIDQTPGPCDYEHHVPKDMINNSNPKWDWKNQTDRREPVQNPEGGPGTYEEHRRFDDNARVEEFGQRRIIKTDQTPGPCDYEHHVPQEMIRNSNPQWDWKNQTGRREPLQDPEGGPGTYDERRRFDDNARVEEFGQKREIKIQQTPGPCDYEHHVPREMINNSNPQWNWQNQTGRREPVQDPEGGPGTYDELRRFDDNARVEEFGQKREIKIDQTPGPCDYEHHVPKDMTNNSNPKWNWQNQTGRREPVQDPEGGPGTYDERRRFDDNARVEEFGQKREIKIDQTPGPCDYEHHVPKDMTNNSNPKWNWQNQTGRREPVQDPEGGPGTYEEHRRFNDNARVEEFGQKREIKIDQTPGPCDYEHHVPKDMTNNSNPKWNWQNQSGRREPAQNPEGGPGTYEEHRRFNDNARVEEFGQKREIKIDQTPGPCDYEHHVPKDMTNNSNPKWNWQNQSGRREPVQDPEGGPGTYDDRRRFDDNARVEEFGQKREIKIDQTPGPCDYEHHVPKDMTNNSNPKWNWQNQSGRREPAQNPEGGPGTYEEHRRFNDNARVEEFGQKREIKIDQTPGPCDYEHHVPKEMTSNSNPKWNWQNQSGRREPAQDPERGPGTYEEHRRFNDNARVEEFGQKREIKIDQTPGPCDYEHHVPKDITNNSNPKWNWENQSGRPDQILSAEGGPGTYEEIRNFGRSSRDLTIGKKRVSRIEESPGPADYEPHVAETLTRSKSAAWNWKNRSPRKQSAIDRETGPGTYEEKRNFGHNAKGVSIGQRRETKNELAPGPGHYSPERAVKTVKSTSPMKDFGRATGRKSQVIDRYGGPGQYENSKTNLVNNLKPMTIGKKADHKIQRSVGPCDYSPTMKATKSQSRLVDFKSKTMRVSPSPSPDCGPGTYHQTSKDFGKQLNKVTIGVPRELQSPDGPGPGHYSPEPADRHTKVTAAAYNFQNSTGRRESQPDPNLGPGSFSVLSKFGDDTKGQTIGERRRDRPVEGPGPCDYSPETSLVKSQSQSAIFHKDGQRFKEGNVDSFGGPGSYTIKNEFTDNQKDITIGVIRENKIEDSVGPQEYHLDSSVKLVKPKTTQGVFAKGPSRASEKADPANGPGTHQTTKYDMSNQLGQKTIGEKRVQKTERTVGPGDYKPKHNVVKPNARASDFINQTKRRTELVSSYNGPGTYNSSNYNLMSSPNKAKTIGVKRDQKTEFAPGPGHYSPEKQLTTVKPKVANVDFSASQGRNYKTSTTFNEQGPGSYNVASKFGDDSRKMSIGVKRTQFVQDTNPGHTPLDDDKHVRDSSPQHNFARQTTRGDTTLKASESYYDVRQNQSALNLTQSFVQTSPHKKASFVKVAPKSGKKSQRDTAARMSYSGSSAVFDPSAFGKNNKSSVVSHQSTAYSKMTPNTSAILAKYQASPVFSPTKKSVFSKPSSPIKKVKTQNIAQDFSKPTSYVPVFEAPATQTIDRKNYTLSKSPTKASVTSKRNF